MLDKDQISQLEVLVSQPGWQLIEDWLTSREKQISNATKKWITIKPEAADKWLNYYSGQYCVIDNLRGYIINNLNKPYRKKTKRLDIK